MDDRLRALLKAWKANTSGFTAIADDVVSMQRKYDLLEVQINRTDRKLERALNWANTKFRVPPKRNSPFSKRMLDNSLDDEPVALSMFEGPM